VSTGLQPPARPRLGPRDVLFIVAIVATQGPRVLTNRIGWRLFGERYTSGCQLCDGKGHKIMQSFHPPDYRQFTWADEKCGSCNGFHD
jgi:hypothetical protein